MGVMRILDHLEMFPLDDAAPKDERSCGPPNTVLCSKGFWVSAIVLLMRGDTDPPVRFIQKRVVSSKFILVSTQSFAREILWHGSRISLAM